MTQNNVIQLFALSAPSEVDSTKTKLGTKNHPLGDALEASLKALHLDNPHPISGLKYGGFIPLSCIMFAPEIFHTLNPSQFKLLGYLSFLKFRYPERSGYVRAALPYLSFGTGISRSTVQENLIHLESLRLIARIETNLKLGNLYQIADVTLWSPSESQETQEQSKKQQSENQTAEIQTTAVQISDGCNPESRLLPSKNQTEDYTSLDSSKLSYSLSQHDGFKKRWKTLTKKAAKRERDLIWALLEKNPNDLKEIYETLVEIETTGKTYEGVICHSPVGLIASSWPRIKRIRFDRKRNAAQTSEPKVDTSSQKIRKEILLEIHNYISTLEPSEIEALHQDVESEIKKARPNLLEIRKETRMYQSFLETIVAAKLGRELPETN